VITACDLVLPDNVIYIPKAQGIFEELIEKVGIPTSPFTIYVHEGLITYRGPSFDCPNFDSLPHFVSTIPCVQNHWSSPAIGQPVNIKHILATTEFQDGIVEIQNTVVIRIAKDIGPDWKEFSRLSKLYGTVSFLSAQMGDGPPIVEDIQIIKVRDSNGMFKLLWRLLEYQCIPTYLVMREYHVIHVGSSHQLENHIKKAIQH
jgi:hypothetical protein